jgi:hypothetical protein
MVELDEYAHYNLEPTVFGVFGVVLLLHGMDEDASSSLLVSMHVWRIGVSGSWEDGMHGSFFWTAEFLS